MMTQSDIVRKLYLCYIYWCRKAFYIMPYSPKYFQICFQKDFHLQSLSIVDGTSLYAGPVKQWTIRKCGAAGVLYNKHVYRRKVCPLRHWFVLGEAYFTIQGLRTGLKYTNTSNSGQSVQLIGLQFSH